MGGHTDGRGLLLERNKAIYMVACVLVMCRPRDAEKLRQRNYVQNQSGLQARKVVRSLSHALIVSSIGTAMYDRLLSFIMVRGGERQTTCVLLRIVPGTCHGMRPWPAAALRAREGPLVGNASAVPFPKLHSTPSGPLRESDRK